MYNQILFTAAANGYGNDKNGPQLWNSDYMPTLVKHLAWMLSFNPQSNPLR